MSLYETDRRRRKPHGDTIWTALRANWLGFVLLAGALVAFIFSPSRGEEVFGLSREALAAGRWWTLFTHILSHPDLIGLCGLWLAAVALTEPIVGESNPARTASGWEFPALFLFCSVAAAAVHLVAAPHGIWLIGVWPGVLGLIAYRWWKGRGVTPKEAVEAPRELKGMGDERSRLLTSAFNESLLFVAVVLGLISLLTSQPWPIEVSLGVALGVGAVAGVGLFLLLVFHLQRVSGFVWFATTFALLAVASMNLLGKILDPEWRAEVGTYPVAALVTGLMTGLVCGEIVRRRARRRRSQDFEATVTVPNRAV